MKIHVKPKQGLKVVRPDTKQALKPEGEFVESSPYWTRRLKDGDIELVQEMKKQVEEKKSEEKASGGKK